jgi:cell division septum initiation protein DivIVA
MQKGGSVVISHHSGMMHLFALFSVILVVVLIHEGGSAMDDENNDAKTKIEAAEAVKASKEEEEVASIVNHAWEPQKTTTEATKENDLMLEDLEIQASHMHYSSLYMAPNLSIRPQHPMAQPQRRQEASTDIAHVS